MFLHFKNCVRIHFRRTNVLLFKKTTRLCEGKVLAWPEEMEWGRRESLQNKRAVSLVREVHSQDCSASLGGRGGVGPAKAWEWVSEVEGPHPLLEAEILLFLFSSSVLSFPWDIFGFSKVHYCNSLITVLLASCLGECRQLTVPATPGGGDNSWRSQSYNSWRSQGWSGTGTAI